MQVCKCKGMYVCNYGRIKVCIMCICNYASIKIYRYQPCKYEIMERFMYKRIKSIQVCRACMQIFKCVGMPLCMYASTQVSNYVILHPGEYLLISYCHTRVYLGSFSSAWNLAILQVGPKSALVMYLDMTNPLFFD